MKTELPKEYYHYRIQHGESETVYTVYFVENKDSVDLTSFKAKDNTPYFSNGLDLAEDFCKRMNLHLGIDYEDLKKVIQPDPYKKISWWNDRQAQKAIILKYLKEND